MTATWSYDERPRSGDPLLPGASPAAISAALLLEDRAEFNAAYDQALRQARSSMDLTELFRMLEQWRRIALLQRDRARYLSLIRRAAERLTGQAVPEDEPLATTRSRVGL